MKLLERAKKPGLTEGEKQALLEEAAQVIQTRGYTREVNEVIDILTGTANKDLYQDEVWDRDLDEEDVFDSEDI
jgi:hypothetical protein